MLEIIDNKKFSKVTSIEISNEEKPVYDIFVPNGNNYLANGFISHNTVMAVYCACKLGVKTIVIAKQHEFIANFYKDFMRFTNISKLTKHPDKIIKLIEGPQDLKYLKEADIALVTYQKFIGKDADERIAKYINGNYSFTVIDECHSGSAVAFAKFLNKLVMKYRLGLSATPLRKDGRHVIGKSILGPVVAKSESVGLVPTIDLLETGIYKNYTSNSPAIWSYMLRHIYGSEKRNKLIVDWVFRDLKAGHKMIIIPTDHKKHLYTLLKMLTEEAKRRAARGETIRKEKIDWRNFAVGFYAGCPRDQILEDIDNERYKVVVTIRSMMKEGVNMKTPSCIYIQTPMSASSNKEKTSKRGGWQYIGSPYFYQLTTRICTAVKDKKPPVIRLFVDNIGPSLGCMRSLALFEIMPGIRKGLHGENPKYILPSSVQQRIFDIMKSRNQYKPLSYSDFRAQYKQYDER